MKLRLRVWSLLLCASAVHGAQAAVVELRANIRPGPAAPAPVLAPVLSPVSLTGAPSIAAPSLRPTLYVPVSVPQIQPVPALSAAPASAPSAPTVKAQEAPARSALAATSVQVSALAQAKARETPSETLSAQAAQTFDGARLRTQPDTAPPGDAGRAVAAASSPQPLRLIITGPPGSGKGTYSEKIARDYGVVHISVGELLRDYARGHADVSAIMATGRLVDSKLVLDVVRQRLAQRDVRERGFILDGFPRRPEEAAALQEMLGNGGLDGVIELDVPETELLRRILARGRADDKADVFKERMRIYREQTVPAVERFKSAAPVLSPEVSGSDASSNYSRVKAALAGLLDKLLGR